MPSRRKAIHISGLAISGALTGCLSAASSKSTSDTTSWNETSNTASTTEEKPESTPWWVRRLLSGPSLDPSPDWPEGKPVSTIEIGDPGNPRVQDSEDYRGMLIVNRDDQTLIVTVGVSKQNKIVRQQDIQLDPDAYTGVGLFVPADYRIHISTEKDDEYVDITEPGFGCNDHRMLITISSPTQIDSYHQQTLASCEGL